MWKKIDTAPKDGTEILLYGEEEIYVGAWDNSNALKMFIPHDVCKECFCCGPPAVPTHWKPLPEPPNKDQE